MPMRPKIHGAEQRAKEKERRIREIDKRRGSSTERGYDGQWQRLRAWYLKRHPLCNRCPDVVPATVVHHKTPISEGGERLDVENLEALCLSCHSKHHGFG